MIYESWAETGLHSKIGFKNLVLCLAKGPNELFIDLLVIVVSFSHNSNNNNNCGVSNK